MVRHINTPCFDAVQAAVTRQDEKMSFTIIKRIDIMQATTKFRGNVTRGAEQAEKRDRVNPWNSILGNTSGRK